MGPKLCLHGVLRPEGPNVLRRLRRDQFNGGRRVDADAVDEVDRRRTDEGGKIVGFDPKVFLKEGWTLKLAAVKLRGCKPLRELT